MNAHPTAIVIGAGIGGQAAGRDELAGGEDQAARRQGQAPQGKKPTQAPKPAGTDRHTPPVSPPPVASASRRYEEKKKVDADTRRRRRVEDERKRRIADLEGRITEREREIKTLEAEMALPTFYQDREKAESTMARHHQLMWEVGDLMNQWETLQEAPQTD